MIVTFSSGEKKVDVNVNDLSDLIENYIDNVKNFFGYQNIRLIYKGMEMDHKKPFSKYNIKEKDVILCAAKKSEAEAPRPTTSGLVESAITQTLGRTNRQSILNAPQPSLTQTPVLQQLFEQDSAMAAASAQSSSLEQEITRMITQLTQRISGQSTAPDVRVTALSYGPQTPLSQLLQSFTGIAPGPISPTEAPPPQRQNIWSTPVDPQATGLYNLEQIHATFISAFPSIIFDPTNPEFRQDPINNLQTERVRSILLTHLQNSNNFLSDLRQGNFESAYNNAIASRPANSQNLGHQEGEDEESGDGTEEEEENEIENPIDNREALIDSDEEEILTEDDHEKIRRLMEFTGANIERATQEYLASHKNLDRAANNLIN